MPNFNMLRCIVYEIFDNSQLLLTDPRNQVLLLSKNPVTVEWFSSPIPYFCDKNKGNLALNQSSNLETCISFGLIFI